MRLTVRVKPNARATKVEQLEDGSYKVSVQAIADKGKANEAVIETLADYLSVPKSTIEIISGHTAKIKIVKVSESVA